MFFEIRGIPGFRPAACKEPRALCLSSVLLAVVLGLRFVIARQSWKGMLFLCESIASL